MKVLDLRCANEHDFEGWFASQDDFVSQDERRLVACPICGDTDITRLPSAPRLNIATQRGEVAPSASAPAIQPTPPAASAMAAWQARALRAVHDLIAKTEDVGERFAEEARRIHYGEAEGRSIRGQASSADADALRDEGIEVYALPSPAALKGPLQ